MASLRRHVQLFVNRRVKCTSLNIDIKKQHALNTISVRKISHVPVEYSHGQDPAPLFFNDAIQNILKKLTRVNMNKVYQHRRLETRKLETPVYKFMTDDELKQALEEAADRAKDMLQMPPVIKVREPIDEVVSRDPALFGYDTAKFVFTDITHGISNRDRLIVIRDAEGNLVKADWDTRQRMNQIYFPQTGRELNTPRMFLDEFLKSLLDRKEYSFILDRACAQFEPDDPEYQKITSHTYQHLNENNDFESLRSTRHFGPLAFYLAWHKNIDNLLLELIETSQISDANSLIELYNKLHHGASVGSDVVLESDVDLKLLERYVAEKSAKKGQLELALQSYKELLKQRLDLEKGIRAAHGVAQ